MRNSPSFAKLYGSKRSPSNGRRPFTLCLRIVLLSCIALRWFGSISAQSVQPFSKTFYYSGQPANTLNWGEASLQTTHGIYLVIGNANNAIGQYFTVVKIDSTGNSLKQISIHHPVHRNFTYPTNIIIEDSNGDILVVTTIGRVTENPYDGFLTKLTPDLDTLWTRTYDLPPTLAGCPADTFVGNYFTAIRQCPDGGYIIAGNYRLNCQPGTISDRACLLKVDTAGEVEWWQVYPNHARIFDVEVTPDSGFVFLHSKAPGYDIVKLDKLGNIMWDYSLDHTFNHMITQDLELINDSIIAIVGSHLYDQTSYLGSRGISFFLFNINHISLISSRYFELYSSVMCATIHQNLKLQPLDDGFIIAATGFIVSPDSSQTRYKGVLFKLSNNGDSVWVRYYQYGDFIHECQFNDVQVMEDGGFLAVGYHFPGTVNAGAWLVLTDSNGYAPGAYPTGIFKPEPIVSELKLYPNPTRGITWLELPECSKQEDAISIEIININGTLVQSKAVPINNRNARLDLQHLPSGVYILSASIKGSHRHIQRLIIY